MSDVSVVVVEQNEVLVVLSAQDERLRQLPEPGGLHGGRAPLVQADS